MCDRPSGINKLICPACKGRLKLISGPVCFKCGKKLRESEDEYCYDCSHQKHYYFQGRGLYIYNSVSSGIYSFKYKGRAEYADYYGQAMADSLGSIIRKWGTDIIIPVPLHRSRQIKRGYNQSALLAKVIANQLNIPYSDKIVYRKKKTIPMKKLGVVERQTNLKNAFIVSDIDVKLKTIVIVDDIYTTGSTIDAMAIKLLEKGAGKVCFVTLSIGTGF